MTTFNMPLHIKYCHQGCRHIGEVERRKKEGGGRETHYLII